MVLLNLFINLKLLVKKFNYENAESIIKKYEKSVLINTKNDNFVSTQSLIFMFKIFVLTNILVYVIDL